MKSSLIALIFALIIPVTPLQALEDDSEKPIYIEANSAFYDEKTDRSTYTGNVVLIQGSLKVLSDKMVAYLPNGEVEKVIFYGNPVRFWQQPKPNDEEIHGTSKRAEYYLDKEVIILIDDAVVWHGTNQYTSDRIEYDQKTGVIKAGEAKSDTKRVKIILNPKKKPSSGKPSKQ